MLRRLNRVSLLLGLALLSFFLAACEEKKIVQIMAEPDRYARHEVGVRGHVIESYSMFGRGAYRVDDGSGKLWIVSDRGVPRTGSRVAVKGKIVDGFDLGAFGPMLKIPEKLRSGLVMLENDHRAKF
jgi:hypothetical protein